MQEPYFLNYTEVTNIKGSALFVRRNIGFIEFRIVSMIFRRFLYFSSVGAAPGFFISHPHPAQAPKRLFRHYPGSANGISN